MLTSHYMKDVEALCKRAIIINEGQIKHDGPLEEIVDRFSQNKIIELAFAGASVPEDITQFGQVIDLSPPRVQLEVDRNKIPEILAAMLNKYQIEDVSVQDRPLEEVIAEMFENKSLDSPQ